MLHRLVDSVEPPGYWQDGLQKAQDRHHGVVLCLLFAYNLEHPKLQDEELPWTVFLHQIVLGEFGISPCHLDSISTVLWTQHPETSDQRTEDCSFLLHTSSLRTRVLGNPPLEHSFGSGIEFQPVL